MEKAWVQPSPEKVCDLSVNPKVGEPSGDVRVKKKTVEPPGSI